jgi:aminoglycoside phosphotransferase (APT) family kinase protein
MSESQETSPLQALGHELPSDLFVEDLVCRVLGSGGDWPSVLERAANLHSSSYPSEVVTCRMPDGSELQLHCKYESGLTRGPHLGGDVAYEAQVFRHVLADLQLSRPRFYGAGCDEAAGGSWLAIQYIAGGFRLNRSPLSDGLVRAAMWAASFHRLHESRLDDPKLAFLERLDARSYLPWAIQAEELPDLTGQERDLLRSASQLFEALGEHLRPTTLIHGEFFPLNVLVADRAVYPVDWQTAGFSAGEIDLAMLVHAWPEDVVRQACATYVSTRWPEGAPSSFYPAFQLARLYIGFRGLVLGKERSSRIHNIAEIRSASLHLEKT